MEYVIPVILVLVIAAAGIIAFVMNSQRKTREERDGVASDAEHGGGPGIGADTTPLGDTAEHAGTQSHSGVTVDEPDAPVHGGTGHPVNHYGASVPPEREREIMESGDDPIAGQGVAPEAARDDGVAPKGNSAQRDSSGPPDSERLADRPA